MPDVFWYAVQRDRPSRATRILRGCDPGGARRSGADERVSAGSIQAEPGRAEPCRTSPIASAVAGAWRLDGPPTFVRSSSNFVYAAMHLGRPCYLRFADVDEGASPTSVQAELVAMATARAHGLRAPVPIPTPDGHEVVISTVERHRYVAILLTELEGKELEIDDLDPDRCRRWGELIAHLQAALAHVPPETWAARPSYAIGSPSAGLVHLDVELDNLRWTDDGPGVLDFDDLATHEYAMDVASALRDLDGRPDLSAALLDGYEAAGGAAIRDDLADARTWLMNHTRAKIAGVLDLPYLDDKPGWLQVLDQR